jgi:lysophospholipase L1-like esterase
MYRKNAARFTIALIAALLALSWSSEGHGPSGTAQAAGSKQPSPFVLGMGDSIAWGFQAFPVDPNTTYPGFVDRFAERLVSSPHQKVIEVNYSCNGESTSSLIEGVPTPSGPQCFGKAVFDSPAHNDYNGTQLDAAVTFLRQQTRDGIVLLSIGGNDPLDNPTVAACNFDLDCWTQVFQIPSVRDEIYTTALHNYKTILSALLAANRQVRILALNAYELDENDPFTTTGILNVVNAALAHAIKAIGSSRVTLVDTTTTFTPSAICEGGLTEWCFDDLKYLSVHPTDAGYVALTDLACDASRVSTTHKNHLKCRSGNFPKPVAHGRLKPENVRAARHR